MLQIPNVRVLRLLCLILLACTASLAQSRAPSPTGQNTSGMRPAVAARPPRDWAADTAANEVEILQHEAPYLRYRVHTVDQKGDRVRDLVECQGGTVARVIRRDGRSLTQQEDKDERDRLADLLKSPADFNKHAKTEASSKKLAADLVTLMPDSMIYTYVPGQPQIADRPGMQLVVLDYEPNPHWSPPNTTSEALTGLKGRMWIDSRTHRLVRMEGSVFRGVNFGWGMLAHVYPGGRLVLEQSEVNNQRWIYSRFSQDTRVRALMVKLMDLKVEIVTSDYQTIPVMSYQDAIRLLLATPLPTR